MSERKPGQEARDPASASAPSVARQVSLALQGGGAHGAFTWGVLDRLLEDERIVIEAISGTSAGAMNAAALAAGYAAGGREGARQALDRFWISTSEYAIFSPIPAHADRAAARKLEPRPFTELSLVQSSRPRCTRRIRRTRSITIHCGRSSPGRSISMRCARARRSASSSRRRMCAPAAPGFRP